MSLATQKRHHVVIIGSGFGGIFAARKLRKSDVDITLIARTSHHLFQPLLYQVATGILSEGEIAPSSREILNVQDNTTVLLGDVTDIDITARTVTSKTLTRETVTTYDSLIVAAGAGQSYFGNDHFAEYAPGMKTIDDALELRGRILICFELAEVAAEAAGDVEDVMALPDVQRLLTFVVVGAGPTGVEMAGQIAELARRTLRKDFRRIDPTRARIILVDGADQVLPPFGPELGAKAQARLERMGVEVRLGLMVTDVHRTGLVVKDKQGNVEEINAVAKVWAAGVAASPLGAMLAQQCGATVDRAGRIGVNADLTLPGHPEVFVVGDMIALDNLPGVAQVAIQGARFAGATIDARLAGDAPPERFVYKDKGSMATISRFSAVASIGKLKFSGFIAWLLWLVIHLLYIVGFKHKVTTLLHWAVSFLGRTRSERTFTEQQTYGRLLVARGLSEISLTFPTPRASTLEPRQ